MNKHNFLLILLMFSFKSYSIDQNYQEMRCPSETNDKVHKIHTSYAKSSDCWSDIYTIKQTITFSVGKNLQLQEKSIGIRQHDLEKLQIIYECLLNNDNEKECEGLDKYMLYKKAEELGSVAQLLQLYKKECTEA